MKSKTQVKCPTCKKPLIYEEVETRPFCSERCKLIDLGEWASEGYKIPVKNSSNFNEFGDGDNKENSKPEVENSDQHPLDHDSQTDYH